MGLRFQSSAWKRLLAAGVLSASLIGGLVHTVDAAGKVGMVRPKSGTTAYFGEVDETSDKTYYIVTQGPNQVVKINKQNGVVTYFNSDQEEFDARMAALGPQDFVGRLNVARWAIAKKQPGMARTALDAAKKIDAKNVAIPPLEKQLATLQPPPTQPTTVAATAPAVPEFVEEGPARRLLTADEIQLVRRREMRPGEKLRYQVPPEMRKQVVDAQLATPQQARSMRPEELADMILAQGNDQMKSQIKIVSEPAAIMEYRTKLNRVFVSGCAAANCHGGKDGGRLVLFTQDKEDAALTNFVIFQKFEKSIDGIRRPMIDRVQPLNSLLLSYILPDNLTNIPHPKVDGFKSLTKTNRDPAYGATYSWISSSLNITPPSYQDIDLSK